MRKKSKGMKDKIKRVDERLEKRERKKKPNE